MLADNKAARLGDELPRHDLVALGDLGHGGGADVLCERDRHHVGQRKHLDRFGAAQFIFRRMDSAIGNVFISCVSLI